MHLLQGHSDLQEYEDWCLMTLGLAELDLESCCPLRILLDQGAEESAEGYLKHFQEVLEMELEAVSQMALEVKEEEIQRLISGEAVVACR